MNWKRNYLTAALAAGALCLPAAHTAFAADNCKNVRIIIKNGTADEIKVKKFEYFDFDKTTWRTENMFGVDGFQKLEPGKSEDWTRDLEQVGGDKTQFRVTYVHHIGGSKWGDDIKAVTGSFTCTEELVKTVTLTQ